jgi:hypothetical protein
MDAEVDETIGAADFLGIGERGCGIEIPHLPGDLQS